MTGVLIPALVCAACVSLASLAAQTPAPLDTAALEAETLEHFQALIRFDTSDPPGGEQPAAAYLRQVLEREGIPVQVLALEPGRSNLIARLKGSGKKRPLLLMAHTDVVNVDPSKWMHPPFGADRDGGHIYGRGTLDDKDNVTAALMVMLTLKRRAVPLDRDVIFLAEAGEEGSTRVGIQFLVNQHFNQIDAEYCIAETGNVMREGGRVKYATVQTLEKHARAIEFVAHGPAGHGSVPLKTNAISRLSAAVAAAVSWQPPMKLNETTGTYFKRLADISPAEDAARYRALLSLDPKVSAAALDYLAEFEPAHASMLRNSLSPTRLQAGYRFNVIPSEATATFDVRLLPGEDAEKFLAQVREVVNDSAVEVRWGKRDLRPAASDAQLDSEAFRAIEAAIRRTYDTVTLPTMSTGATDMAFLRAKGVQCYGVGPGIDIEDGAKGFGSHSDQERILERELHRFVQFQWDAVTSLAGQR